MTKKQLYPALTYLLDYSGLSTSRTRIAWAHLEIANNHVSSNLRVVSNDKDN